MALIQIFLTLAFLLAAVKVWLKYRNSEINLTEAIYWNIFWALGAVFVLWPNLSAKFAIFFGVGRGADLVVYLSIALIFFLIFKLMVKIEKINREITLLVRKESLKK